MTKFAATATVETFTLKQSMSRAYDPYDNACAESLWSRLKAELDMPKGGYESIEKLKSVLFVSVRPTHIV